MINFYSSIFVMHPPIKPANAFDNIGPNPYKIPGLFSLYLLKFNTPLVPAI